MTTSRDKATTADTDLSAVVVAYKTMDHGKLSDRTYAALRHAIVTGDLEANTRIRETDLAAVIPVSRTPIREALFRLKEEGLLQDTGQRTLEVRDVDLRQMFQTYEILEALEPLAAKLATHNMTPEIIGKLRDSVDLAEFFFERGRWDDVTRESREFHRVIYHASGNDRLVSVIERLREETHRFRRFRTRDAETALLAFKEDRLIVDALEKGDAEEASRVMFVHIHWSTEAIQAELEHGSPE